MFQVNPHAFLSLSYVHKFTVVYSFINGMRSISDTTDTQITGISIETENAGSCIPL